jgi:hypothetical protein
MRQKDNFSQKHILLLIFLIDQEQNMFLCIILIYFSELLSFIYDVCLCAQNHACKARAFY